MYVCMYVCMYVYVFLVCNEPMGYHEKKYVIELTQKYRTPKNINWKYVIRDLEKRFGKLHSENKVKNYWYSTARTSLRRLSELSFDDIKHSPMMITIEPTEPTYMP